MNNIKLLILIQGMSFAVLADSNQSSCSSLLASIIETTQNISPSKTWVIGQGTLKISYQDGKIILEGLKETISLAEKMTSEQLEILKNFTTQNSDRMSESFDRNSNRSALKEAVNYARLHGAFYGKMGKPIEAAREISSLLERSSKRNPNVKIQIRAVETNEKQLEKLGSIANDLTLLEKLHREGKLEQSIKDYQDQQQQVQGAQIVDGILGKDSSASLEDVIHTTEARARSLNPEAVEVEVSFSHDEPLRVHIERTGNGKLKINPVGKPGFSVKSLRALVDWLQGKGFDGKSYDWRANEMIENKPF